MAEIGRIEGMKPSFPTQPAENLQALADGLQAHIQSFADHIRKIQQDPAHLQDSTFLKEFAGSVIALNGVVENIHQTIS